MMNSRVQDLLAAIRGFEVYQVPFFGITINNNTYHIGARDDPGLFVIVALLGQVFNGINPIELSVIFLEFTRFVAFGAFIFFAVKLGNKDKKNIIFNSLFALFIILWDYKREIKYDVYWISHYFPLIIGTIFFLLHRNKGVKTNYGIFYSLVAGFLVFLSNLIRVNSAIVFIVFSIIILFKNMKNTKALFSIALIGSFLFFNNFYLFIERQASSKLSTQIEALQKIKDSGHPVWHTAYLGLGFLENSYGIKWSDQVAFTITTNKPPVGFKEVMQHEAIMKEEYLSFLKNHPVFAVKTYVAKFGKIALENKHNFLIILLIVLCLRKKDFTQIDSMLLGGMLFALIPGVLAMPYREYYAGFYPFFYLFLIYRGFYCFSKVWPLLKGKSYLSYKLSAINS